MYPFPFENFLNLFPRFSRFYYRITCPWEGLEVFCLVNMVTTYNSKISENENCWLPKAHVCEHMPLLCFQDPSVFKPVALICCDGLNREECTCAIHTGLRTKSSSPHWLEILHLFSPLLSEVFSGQDWTETVTGSLAKGFATATFSCPQRAAESFSSKPSRLGEHFVRGCFHNTLNTVRSVSVKVQFARLTWSCLPHEGQGRGQADWMRSLKANQSPQCTHHFTEIVWELAIERDFCLEQSFTRMPQNELFSNSPEYGSRYVIKL